MVIVDEFTHYVTLNPVPHCNAYDVYTTLLCEHWIAKFGLPEILVTDNGTEFISIKKSLHYAIYTKLDTNHERLMPHGLMV